MYQTNSEEPRGVRDNREELARVLHHPGHVTPSRVKSHCLVLLVVDQKGLLSFR